MRATRIIWNHSSFAAATGLSLVIAATLVGTPATAMAEETEVMLDTDVLARHLERAMESLSAIEATTGKGKKKVKEEAEIARSEIEAALDALRRAEKARRSAISIKLASDRLVARPVPAPADDSHRELSEKGLKALLKKLSRTSVIASRHEELERVAERYTLTSAQVERIVSTFTFDRDRARAAESLFAATTDRDDFDRVVERIGNAKLRKSVLKRLGLADD